MVEYSAFVSPDDSALVARVPIACMADKEHVLALRVDASYGSGHWYEGGGIYRDCFIIATQGDVFVAENGLYAPTSMSVSVEGASAPFGSRVCCLVCDVPGRFPVYICKSAIHPIFVL